MNRTNYLKKFRLFLLFCLPLSFILFLSGCSDSIVEVQPEEDTTSVIRNPAMGWVLYADAFAGFPDAYEYWRSQDVYAESASIFYLRLPWSQLEPEEGLYAWENDQNYKDLIQGALDRGLNLAFRVYVDSEGSYRQATPDYVREYGANGMVNLNNNRWDPYVDNSLFQEKFTAFINAFAAQYNNPEIVDYIDANGLGRWGEGNRLKLEGEDKYEVLRWITETYATNFTQVLLGVQYNKSSTGFGLNDIDAVALEEYGYVIRKDTLGLPYWFTGADKERIRSHFPAVPFYGENVYQYLESRRRWKKDYGTLLEALEAVLSDALYLHANTLDLRIPEDTEAWFSEAPDLVNEFIIRGGYRLSPEKITYPARVEQAEEISIFHAWKNTGVGVLPNNTPQWNYKYKVAFALIDPVTEEVILRVIDEAAEPSDWIEGELFFYVLKTKFDSVPAGSYTLGFAIIDSTMDSTPAINLAINNKKTDSGWYVLGSIIVN